MTPPRPYAHVARRICLAGWLLLCLSLALGALPARASVAECSVPEGGLSLDATLQSLADPDAALDADDARQAWTQGRFVPHVPGTTPSYGFVRGVLWVYVELPPVDVVCNTLLVLGQPRVDRVDIFDPVSQGRDSALAMGASLPYADRAVDHRFPNVRLFRTPGDALPLLLRVQSGTSVQLPLALHTEATLYGAAYGEQVGMGMFYGVLLALLLYNLAVMIGTRDTTYTWAVLYLVAMGLFTLTFMGQAAQFLRFVPPAWHVIAVPLSLLGLVAAALAFVRSFLDLPHMWPLGDRLARALILGAGLAALLCWGPALRYASMSATLLGLGGCVLAAVGGVVCARRGHRLAYVFLLSWGVLILFAVGIALSAFGWIPRTLVSEYGLQLGAAAQMVVLSLALVYRIHLLRTEKQQLEHEAERAASRKHLQEQLQQALDERNTILENSLVAIVFLNPDGRVLWANAATGLMFGLTQGLPVGETLDAFYPSVDDCRKAHAVVHGAIADGRPFEDERRMRRSDGSLFWAYTSGRAVNPTDVSRGTVWTMVDITHRRQAEDEMRESLARQKELSELKTRFVSMASHEFRTPLATILSSAELLRYYLERLTPEERNDTLQSIESAVQRMTRMLDDVLVIGKGEAQRDEFRPGALALRPLCESVVNEVRQGAARGARVHHEVVLTLAQEVPTLWLDEQLVRQILGNLLSNAIKYSPEGGAVQLDARLQDDRAHVRFVVTDQGLGMPAQDMHRLFETFFRASNVGNISGTGLGLSIVKRAVDLHGGSIDVTSQLGQGTCFTVTLPCAAPDATA